MPTPHRAVVLQLAEWIQQEVPELSSVDYYSEEPITYKAQPSVTVWWENGAERPEENTTGWLGTTDTYGIRYSEPAPEHGRLLRDEARGEEIEALMTAVVGVIFNHRTDLPAPNHDLRWTGHARLGPTEGLRGSGSAAFRSGFEVSCTVGRPMDYL